MRYGFTRCLRLCSDLLLLSSMSIGLLFRIVSLAILPHLLLKDILKIFKYHVLVRKIAFIKINTPIFANIFLYGKLV